MEPIRQTLRITRAILEKDWRESWRQIFFMAAFLFTPTILTVLNSQSLTFRHGLMAGALGGSAWALAQGWFQKERQNRTLELLLALPAKPYQVVIAKHVSLCSAILFMNIPSLLSGDFRLTFIATSFGLLMAVTFMACTVVSDKLWAPQIPFWILMVLFVPLGRLQERFFPIGLELLRAMQQHPEVPALVALLWTPIIAAVSALVFHYRESM